MKKITCFTLFLLFMLVGTNCLAQTFKKGDVNHDGTVDISDVVAVINTIAGNNTYKDTADVNKDTMTDISDVVAIINIIAGGSSQDENNIQLSDLTEIIFNGTGMSVVNGDKTTNYTIEEGLELNLVNPGTNADNKFLDIYSQGKIVASLTFKDADKLSFGENGSLIFWLKDEILYQTTSKVDNIVVYDKSQEPLVYLGIIGFNQELYKQPFGVLAQSTASTFNSFVNSLTYRDGTILYYAVDNALDMIFNYGFSTSLSSVNLITFTDGLDQGSLMMNSNYSTETAYLNALSDRIGNMKVAGLPLTAYSLGLRGNDVSDNTMFTTNLRKLASSADNATEVTSIYDVESQLQGIADQIISVSTRKNISVRIPGPATGTTVRFVFDGKSPETSSLYIEGVFNMSDMSLTNMHFHGFKTTSGTVVRGTRDGIFVSFSFKGLQLSDGNGLFSTSNIRQYNKTPNSTTWQVNSEFSPESNVQTTVTYSGCAIMLVLDCSRSLGSDFSRMQSYVRNFIDKIARSTADFEVQAPTDVSAKLTNASGQPEVMLSWIASKHADSYIIYRSSSSTGSYTKIADNITSTVWKDPSPLSGWNYYKVVAVGSGLESEQSSYASVNYAVTPPADLSAIMSETEGVVLSWSASPFAQSYTVYRSGSSSGTYSVVAEGVTSTTWSDASPLSGTNYYKVATVGYGMVSEKSSYAYVDLTLAPPTNLSASMAAHDGKPVIDLSWTKSSSPYAQSYTVYRSGSSSGTYSVVAEGIKTTSWSDPSPLSGWNYYKVAAVGYGITGSQSSYTSVNYALASPADLSAKMVERNGKWVVDLSWSASQYAQNYTVYRSDSYSGTYSVIAENVTSTSWTDQSPLSGMNFYKISASGNGITSSQSYSASVSFTIASPTDLTASLVEQNGQPVVSLSWSASQNAQSYTVYRSGSPSEAYSVVAEGVKTTSWSDASPLPGKNYYQVASESFGVFSEKSSYAFVDFTLAPPTELSASFEANKGIVLSWTASRYAQIYTVYRSNNSSGDYSVVADNVISTSWTDSSPLSGNNYYKVTASGYGTNSSQSAYAFLNITMEPPTGLTATYEENRGVVDLSWSVSQYAQSYTVYRSENASGTYSVIAEGVTTTSWTDSSPLSGFNYYKVAASGYGLTGERSYAVFVNTLSRTFTVKGVSFNMIPVDGCTFQMGSDDSDSYSNEQPVHQVTLSSFYIGETEVTQELWEAVMGENPSNFKGSKLPVEKVSWNDCQTFITKLSSLTGQQFRLPTEAEWEFAAHGGNSSRGYKYSGSNTLGNVAWFTDNSGSCTHDVATKSPNELGIYDMSGNVWEWCSDWYGSYGSGSQTNPQGPSSGSNRVFRGGGWSNNARNCRVAGRRDFTPDNRDNYLGLRLAL